METENMVLEEEQIEQTEESTEQAQPQAEKIRIKYLGEEKEIDLEEAKTLAQKGMDYERQREKYETAKPTLDGLEEISRTLGFVDEHGHGDTKAYIEAVKEAKRQEEIESLSQESALPKELAEELYLSRQDRIERQKQAELQREEESQAKENLDFLNYFEEVNGRKWDKNDTLPEEVKKLNGQGIPLRFAYSDYLSRQLISEKQIEQQNLENLNTSPGSVNSQTAPIGALTEEMIEAMTPKELMSRWGEVKKVLGMK